MRKQQQGYVLLVLMALVLSAGAGIFVTSVGKSIVERKAAGDRKVLGQLKNVKQRLLTYAATHPEIYEDTGVPSKTPGPGYLPCPTLNANAEAAGSCNEDVASGWLPRKITGKDVSFEAEGLDWRRVWFVLDTRFAIQAGSSECLPLTKNADDARCTPLNTALNANRIKLNAREGYVALLIYAGGTLSGQNRSAAVPDIADYLDGANADEDVDNEFSTRGEDSDNAFNDIVLPITKQEWDRVIAARVKQSATDDSADWCNSGAPAWFARNEWNANGKDICN